ncbi:GPP34 family phosphoprotein [Micromonospora sp. NPDC049114]|uniref:GOLPH3/VPS74 family protein n=1 Tax=Micromonospora sp. NPDC049114 TaxID=3155498 RepID=UPI0033C6057F
MSLSSVAEAMEPPWLDRGEVSRCDDLFLLGHDDTGHPHVHRQTLILGLAGAVLIDWYLAGRVTLYPNIDTHAADHQRIHPHIDRPVGDLIADATAATIRNAHPLLSMWLRAFSPTRTTAPSPTCSLAGSCASAPDGASAGLMRADTYLPSDSKWAVIARSRLRYLAAGHEQPNDHSAALAGLVTDLGLTDHLYLDDETPAMTSRLRATAAQHYQPVRDITAAVDAAVDAAVGDLATAT